MRRLLVVEDDVDASSFIKFVLEQEEFEVEVARSAGEAKAALAERAADLIVIDRGLPDQDGLELCREIRGRPGGKGLPVMFLTARKALTDLDDGFSAGADDYLTKPFSFIELLARIKALLRRGGSGGLPAAV
ncbi:MAG: response regulator transcription factor [Elusimicrobia bacterium]|nr:response regulator transcription factor [Elusimicrobiota bacterium]